MDLMTSFSSLLLAITLVGAMVVYSRRMQPEWSQRDFKVFDGQWTWIFTLSAYVAFLVYYTLYTNRNISVSTVYPIVESIPIAVALSLMIAAFPFTLSAWTDAFIYRAPMEIAHFAMALGAILMFGYAITTGDWNGVISAAIWAIVPSLLYLATGFGLADTRLLWVATFCIAWWAGWYMTFMFFGISCLVQLVLSLMYKWTKWGEVRLHKPSSLIISFRKVINTINPKANLKITYEKENRVFTPLIPALAIGYIIVPCVLLLTGNSTLLINDGVGFLFT
jgi:hypothetical protein